VNRGEVYLVKHPNRRDPKRQRAFVVVSRQVLIESKFTTVVCAPVYTTRAGIATQVPVGMDEGLKHESAIHCDELVSLPKTMLTDYIGTLNATKIRQLDAALAVALALEV
jgi:mRNA interferase MazF